MRCLLWLYHVSFMINYLYHHHIIIIMSYQYLVPWKKIPLRLLQRAFSIMNLRHYIIILYLVRFLVLFHCYLVAVTLVLVYNLIRTFSTWVNWSTFDLILHRNKLQCSTQEVWSLCFQNFVNVILECKTKYFMTIVMYQ